MERASDAGFGSRIDTSPRVEKPRPIPLRGRARAGAIALGALFLVLPVAAYLDARLGLLGTPDAAPEAFGLVMAVFVGIGGVLVVSGFLGVWLMWRDVGLLADPSAPDLDRISVVEPAAAGDAPPATTAPSIRARHMEPPVEGQQERVDPVDADRAFLDAARSYYDERLSTGVPFSEALQSVWRSRHGRPNYYFEVRPGRSDVRWIRVPHRAGVDAGS
jgi:hypothetical protein